MPAADHSGPKTISHVNRKVLRKQRQGILALKLLFYVIQSVNYNSTVLNTPSLLIKCDNEQRCGDNLDSNRSNKDKMYICTATEYLIILSRQSDRGVDSVRDIY